jgi:hypothetical protein
MTLFLGHVTIPYQMQALRSDKKSNEFCGSVHETHNPHLTHSEKTEVSCMESSTLKELLQGTATSTSL